MVASCGASMPEPLAMADTVAVLPPTTTSREAILVRVSVVMMASAAKSARAPSCSTSAGIASRIFWAGSRTPMTPVEAVSTARFCTPSASATAPRRLATSSMPRGPVSALALPLFTSTARMPSAGTRSRASMHRRGGGLVDGEEARGGGRDVGDHERHVAPLRLQAHRDAAEAETLGDLHA